MKKGIIFVILSTIITFIFLIFMPKVEAIQNFSVYSTIDILSLNETPNFEILENNTTFEITNPHEKEYVGKRTSEYRIKVLGDNGADIVFFEFLMGQNKSYTEFKLNTSFEVDGTSINPSKTINYLNPNKTSYTLHDCYNVLKNANAEKIDISELEQTYYIYKVTVDIKDLEDGGYIEHTDDNYIFGDEIIQNIEIEENQNAAVFLKNNDTLTFYYLTKVENDKQFSVKSFNDEEMQYQISSTTINDFLMEGRDKSGYDETTYFNLRAEGLNYAITSNSSITNLNVDNMALMEINTFNVNKANDEEFTLKIVTPLYYSLDIKSEPVTYDYHYVIDPDLHPDNTKLSYNKINITIKTPNYIDNSAKGFEVTTEGDLRIYKVSTNDLEDISGLSFKASSTEKFKTKQQQLNSNMIIVVGVMALIFVLFIVPVILNLLSIINIGSFKDYFLPISALFMMSVVACSTYSLLNYQAIGVIFGFSIAYTIATIVDFIATRRIVAIGNTLLGLAVVIFVSVGRVYNYNFNYVFILSVVAAALCYIYLWFITIKKVKLYLVVIKDNRKKKKEQKLLKKEQKRERKLLKKENQ